MGTDVEAERPVTAKQGVRTKRTSCDGTADDGGRSNANDGNPNGVP